MERWCILCLCDIKSIINRQITIMTNFVYKNSGKIKKETKEMEKRIIFHSGDHVGITVCSNGLKREQAEEMERLGECLREMRLVPVFSDLLYETYSVFSGSGKERAHELMRFFEDDKIKAIFDVSGGDLANQLLEYLDYEKIKQSGKLFFGYSDLTVLLNGIYAKTGNTAGLYQIRNLIRREEKEQRQRFRETFLEGGDSLFESKWKFLQGEKIEGIVAGGNIRCFLKLAGTPYFPDLTDKVLFLESLGGEEAVMTSLLSQLRQLGVFQKVRGILLGTFTKMQQIQRELPIEELVKRIVDHPQMPIAKTEQIGHGSDSRCLMLGEHICIRKEKM